jgi:periplasmic protein TonB
LHDQGIPGDRLNGSLYCVRIEPTDMSTPEVQVSAASAEKPATGPGVVSSGWLAADSTYGHEKRGRLGAGLGASLALHGALIAIIGLVLASTQTELTDIPDRFANLVFLQVPGPGGGGGGAPEQAAPKPLEIPKPKAPEPTPVAPVVPVEAPPPPPQLTAPVITPNAAVLQASGVSSVSLAQLGGGGRGRGVGQGAGRGVGEGEGGGTGGGIFRLGAGIVDPKVVKEVRPTYTPDAMRAKIQGEVLLEAVVLDSGLVGDVKVVKSLDPNGLDQEALKAAKKWLFQPATDRTGKPVAVYVTLALSFRIF